MAFVEVSTELMMFLTWKMAVLRILLERDIASFLIRWRDCRKKSPSVRIKMGTASSMMPRLSLLESFSLNLLMAALLSRLHLYGLDDMSQQL